MHHSGMKAENALANPVSVSTNGSSLYPGGREMQSRDSIFHRSATPREDLLRVKLEIPGGNGGNVSMSRPQVGAGHLEDDTHASQMSLEDGQDEHDKDSSISPSDEKDEAMGDESHRSPTLDKKKMKRFRYVVNIDYSAHQRRVADMLPG